MRGSSRSSVLLQALVGFLFIYNAFAAESKCYPSSDSLYRYSAIDINGKNITFSNFKNNVVLVVNVASFWGLTARTYPGLELLYQKYSSKGFAVLGFPCNQFGGQEPGSVAEIKNCLRYVRPGNNFTASFPLFSKVEVNGANTHPLYEFLRSTCPSPTGLIMGNKDDITWEPVTCVDIHWNFEKFLVDKTGKPFKRYTPDVFPDALEGDVQYLLSQ